MLWKYALQESLAAMRDTYLSPRSDRVCAIVAVTALSITAFHILAQFVSG